MDRNIIFFKQVYLKDKEQRNNTSFNRITTVVEEIIDNAQNLLPKIESEESQRHLTSIIQNTLLLLEELNKNESKQRQEEMIKALQIEALCLPNRLQKRSNFSSLCYSVAKACVFLMALSVSFTLGYVFFAWYFAFLTKALFMDYLVYCLASIGIPSLSMGLFSYGLGSLFKEDEHKLEDLKTQVAELGDLATAYVIENIGTEQPGLVSFSSKHA